MERAETARRAETLAADTLDKLDNQQRRHEAVVRFALKAHTLHVGEEADEGDHEPEKEAVAT